MPPWALLAGQIAGAVTVVIITVATLLLTSTLLFEIAMPVNWPLFIATMVLGTACFACLGAAVSTFVTSAEAIDPVIWATMLPLTFISGTFQHIDQSSFIAQLASWFPLRHLLLANTDAFGIQSEGSPTTHLAVVAAWGFAGLIVAVRRFRWAPHR